MRNIKEYPITAQEVEEFIERSWKEQDPPLIGGNDGYIKFALKQYFQDSGNMQRLLDSMRIK